MLVTYPAIFYYDDRDESGAFYYVHFPDFDQAGTQGTDKADALVMAGEWLGIHLADAVENGRELPKPSEMGRLSFEKQNPFKDDEDFSFHYDKEKSFISLVLVDVSKYLGSQEPVKKTLTIPRWADRLGHELGLNFSKTLTEAIAEKKLQNS